MRLPRSAAIPFAAGSAAIHVAYTSALLHSYRLGGFGRTYPLARGIAPVLVGIGGWFIVGEHLSALEILGSVFLSGFLCRIVGSAEHGQQRATVGQVAKTLPWVRLILADLLVVVLVVLGLIALVIPGLIAVTLLAIVGPVIEIEDKHVRAALRRSAHLVRPKFWWVLLLATLPLAVVSELESLAPEPHTVTAALESLAIRGLGTAVLEAVIVLVLVELAYQLIDLDRMSPEKSADSHRRSRGGD